MMPYKIIKSSQPDAAGSGIEKYDAIPVCSREMDIDDMAKTRSSHATLNKTDTVATISGLIGSHSEGTCGWDTATPGQPGYFQEIHEHQGPPNRRGSHQQLGAQCQGRLPAYGVF